MSFQEFWKNQLEEHRKKKNKIIIPEKRIIHGEPCNDSKRGIRSSIIKPGDVNSSGHS